MLSRIRNAPTPGVKNEEFGERLDPTALGSTIDARGGPDTDHVILFVD